MVEGFYTFLDGCLKVKLFGSMENERIKKKIGLPVVDIIIWSIIIIIIIIKYV